MEVSSQKFNIFSSGLLTVEKFNAKLKFGGGAILSLAQVLYETGRRECFFRQLPLKSGGAAEKFHIIPPPFL